MGTMLNVKDVSEKKTSEALDGQGISPEIISELSLEINNMLSFAIRNGITINTKINSLIQNSSVDDLINAHNLLCENIAPATPKSAVYLKKIYQEDAKRAFFGRLPLVRNLIIVSIVFILGFVLTSLSPLVNNDSLDKGVLDNSGIALLLNLVFLASVSGLGVLFYLLKTVSTSIKNGSLVPEDAIYYIALIVLGIMAGLIMSEIVSLYNIDGAGINLFNKSLLALVGGFSSDAIFSILYVIIDKIKNLFSSTTS
jgi:hypothetical protein